MLLVVTVFIEVRVHTPSVRVNQAPFFAVRAALEPRQFPGIALQNLRMQIPVLPSDLPASSERSASSDLRHDACTLVSCSHSEWPCAAQANDFCAEPGDFHSLVDVGRLIIECYNPRVIWVKARVVLRLRLMKCAAIVVNEKVSGGSDLRRGTALFDAFTAVAQVGSWFFGWGGYENRLLDDVGVRTYKLYAPRRAIRLDIYRPSLLMPATAVGFTGLASCTAGRRSRSTTSDIFCSVASRFAYSLRSPLLALIPWICLAAMARPGQIR